MGNATLMPLLGYVYLMLEGDSLIDIDYYLILWWVFHVVQLPIILHISCLTSAYPSFLEIVILSWVSMVILVYDDNDLTMWFCHKSPVEFFPNHQFMFLFFDIISILDGVTLARHVFVHTMSGVDQYDYFWSSIVFALS